MTKKILISLDELIKLVEDNPCGCCWREFITEWFDAQPDIQDMLVEDFLKLSRLHKEDEAR